jgi:hypothetical protein
MKKPSAATIMGPLLKNGKWVTIKVIEKAIEEHGKNVPTNMAHRIYWFDNYLAKIGLTTAKRFDPSGKVTALMMTEFSEEDKLQYGKVVSMVPIGEHNNLSLETSYFWGRVVGDSREIVVVPRGAKPSTVNNEPGRARYHPHLYKRLAELLMAAGVHPKAA